MALNVALVGKEYPRLHYAVTAEAILKYAAATNETNPVFGGSNPVAPPAFPIVAAGRAIRNVLEDPELEVNMPRLVQGEEEHVFNKLIKAGDELEVASVLEKVTGGQEAESFTILTDLVDQEGDVAVQIRSLMVIRGTGPRVRTPAAEEPVRDFLFESREQVDEDQTFRYSEASGDHNLIHVDQDFARNSAGLPGIICHGMCTMAFAARAVLNSIASGDPHRLARIKVEFSRPVFPGQILTTRGWAIEPDGPGGGSYGFETINPRGQAVIKNGLAALR